MVAERIELLRSKLEKQLLDGEPYEEIYKTSIELDDLITEYYKEKGLASRS